MSRICREPPPIDGSRGSIVVGGGTVDIVAPVANAQFFVVNSAGWTEEAVFSIVGTEMPNSATSFVIGKESRDKFGRFIGAFEISFWY